MYDVLSKPYIYLIVIFIYMKSSVNRPSHIRIYVWSYVISTKIVIYICICMKCRTCFQHIHTYIPVWIFPCMYVHTYCLVLWLGQAQAQWFAMGDIIVSWFCTYSTDQVLLVHEASRKRSMHVCLGSRVVSTPSYKILRSLSLRTTLGAASN